jgi:Aspartyl/Asparaginyl beta-hydroxylase
MRGLVSHRTGLLSALKEELQVLVGRNTPSEVQDKAHPSNKTKPTGNVVQFALLNNRGKFADTSEIGSRSIYGKRFHHAAEYPTLATFIGMFPHATSMRLLGMGPNGGLHPHKVNSSWRRGRNWYFTARFHLPIVTNPEALILLDGDLFHLQAGRVYFFHNGCVHSAYNRGETERFDLVWDMLMTQETIDLMSGDDSYPPLERTPSSSRDVPIVKSIAVDEYDVLAAKAYYQRLRLEKLNVDPHKWGNLYLRCRYLWYRFGRPSVATVQ